jgi:hypothetical protein
MRHAWELTEIHTGLWWVNLKDKNHLEDLAIGGSITLK